MLCVFQSQTSTINTLNVVVIFVLDATLSNVQVTQMTLMCDAAPRNLVLDLTGEYCIVDAGSCLPLSERV